MKYSVLVVDDEEVVRSIISEILEPFYEVSSAADAESAFKLVRKTDFAVAIVDLKLPGMDGIEFIKKCRGERPDMVSIILTGNSSVESAVNAMREGAYDFLTKPSGRDDILLHIKRAVEYHSLKRENLGLKKEIHEKYSYDNIIGNSEPIQKIFSLISKIVDSESNILILGETGTGKELVARTIHFNSNRADAPFIPVNCGAIPADLLESELFGHEKGAFTGAVSSRQGRFERADKGTIFLDEIGELAFPLQVKLLRVIQEREFERVGGNKTVQVDVRIIAATNQDLELEVKEKNFREDLFYRLNVIPITLPSLRDRKEDIPLLAKHFLDIMAKSKSRDIAEITDEALTVFKHYQWPGNIRELENIIERVVILKHEDGPITVDDLPEKMREISRSVGAPLDIPDDGVKLTKILEDMERSYILKAMEQSGGVKSKAAELLGINRTTLIEKMRKKGIVSDSKERDAAN
jgi:DNA-binding NtrC family response regulator